VRRVIALSRFKLGLSVRKTQVLIGLLYARTVSGGFIMALMENFDVKTRGCHTGTSTMQRAEIDLVEFGATDFFEAVGLPAPQISLEIITDS
jgi:hypothetical protein